MSAIITGMGAVSSLGPDVSALANGLRDGRCGCTLAEFEHMGGRNVTAPAYLAANADAKGLIDPKKLRRMDRLSRMSAVAARQALAAADIDASSLDPARTGVVFGTAFGALATTQAFMDSWLRQGERHASPLNFMNSVHGILASLIALDLGATGVNLTVSQRDLSFEGALCTALQLIEQGSADVLVVGAADELTPLLHDFATRLRYLSLDPALAAGLDPWHPAGEVVPGEGAAALVLERTDSPRRALARLQAATLARHDNGGDAAAAILKAVPELRPHIDLCTTSRGGSVRTHVLHERRDSALDELLGRKLPKLTHRGNFGEFATAGALQCVANLLMLGGEMFAPLAAGRPRLDLIEGISPPRAILHDAASPSGSHAGYVLTNG